MGTKKPRKSKIKGKKKTKTGANTGKASSQLQQRVLTPDGQEKDNAGEDPLSPDSAEKIKGSASEESIDLTDPDFLHFLLVRELELFEEKMTKKVDYIAKASRTLAAAVTSPTNDKDGRREDENVPEDGGHIPWEGPYNEEFGDPKKSSNESHQQQDSHADEKKIDNNYTIVDKSRQDMLTQEKETGMECPDADSSNDLQRPTSKSNQGNQIVNRAKHKEIKKAVGDGINKKDKIKSLLMFPKIDKELRSSAASASSFAR